MQYVSITNSIHIPLAEMQFSSARSSGPGGQHVNTSSTKIILEWSLENSKSIPVSVKDQITIRIASSITNDGRIIIACGNFRSQDRNKQECLLKFKKLLSKAVHKQKARQKTRTPRSQKEKRLKEKKQRSDIKLNRKKPTS